MIDHYEQSNAGLCPILILRDSALACGSEREAYSADDVGMPHLTGRALL